MSVSYVIFEGVVTLAKQTYDNLVTSMTGDTIQKIKSTYYSIEGAFPNPPPAGTHMLKIEQEGNGLHHTTITLDGAKIYPISLHVSREGYRNLPNTTTIEFETIPLEYGSQLQKSQRESEKFLV